MAPTQKAAEHAEKVVDASVEKWDSYVSELGRAEGEFFGGGAEALGLHGAPENGATWSLMNGIHPVTGERFHTPYWTKVIERLVEDENGRIKKLVSAPSYAAVFAAPKCVSLLLATGYRDDGLEAHRFGVAEATRFLDAHWQVRDRSGAHSSLGLIATSYEHHTPRLLDPEFHLHTHLTIMNFGQRASDGKWLAGDYAHFLRLQKAAGIVYQAATRAELARRIPGIEFELHDNGTADIAQIPAEVRQRFSTRHAQVIAEDREAAKQGVAPGLKRIDYATYKTRSHKDVLDPRVWTEQQRVALAEVGIDDEAIAAWADQERAFVQASWEVRRQDLADRLFGPEGLTEKSNTFNRWAVMEQVGMAHYTDMESFEQLVARTDELLADPRVIAVGEHGRYGVKELDEKEKSVLEMQRHARPRAATRSSRRAMVRDMLTDAELRQGWVFNAGQRAMIEGIATSGERVEVVEALAGSGKTRSLGMLAEILEADGVHVIGAAPTGRARLELIQEAGIEDSHTLASLKVRREHGEQIFDRSRPFVLAVDEAGFSATREFADVFQDAIAAGGQIVMVGDSGQLGSVGAGGLFAAISREREADGRHVYRLAEVVRQRARGGGIDEHEVRALGTLHSGNAEDWVALRERRGQLHVHIGREAGVDGIEHAKNLYLAALERSDASGIYLLSADNAVRSEVNERVREALVERGLIVEAGVIAGRRFAEGERVVLRHNSNAKNLANGMRGTVLAVDEAAGTLTVAIDGRADRIETLDYDYVTGATDSGVACVQGGYANTIHTSQGGTVNETIIVGAAQSLDKERGYVAASRARHATHLVTWDGSAPEYFAEHELTDQEQLDEVRVQLVDALERSGVELSLTEQIAEAGEQLELQFDTAQNPQPRAGQDSEFQLYASRETTSVETIDERSSAQDAKVPGEAAHEPGLHELEQVGDEKRNAEAEETPPLETQQLKSSVAPEPEVLAQPSPYQQAIAAAGAERHRNLCALRDELETATRRREHVHRKFNAAHERARKLGELANALEGSFPTGFAMDPPRYTLDGYARVLDQLAAATKRKQVRELSERAAAARKRLPFDARRFLDRAAAAGSEEREVLARYRQSRAERDQLYAQCAQLWGPAHEGDQDRPVPVLDYVPGTTIGEQTGMTRIRQIQDQIRAGEVALSALSDPRQTIEERLTQALGTNDVYKRPPANLQEANAWSEEWNHGITLAERNGAVVASIDELPDWLHALNDSQLDQVASALERGNTLGQQTMSIGLPPRQAIQEQQRAIDRGSGRGMGD